MIKNLIILLDQFGYEKSNTEFGFKYEKSKWPTVILNYSNNYIIVRNKRKIRFRSKFSDIENVVDYLLLVASQKY